MTVIGTLSSFREPGEMSPHKRACVDRSILGCGGLQPSELFSAALAWS
jgi:hypothetical protein